MPEQIPLPTFFVIGAAKCGTTSLHDWLSQHPEIFATREKEPHFFDYRGRYARGVDHWLQEHYAASQAFPARGESTPSYLSSHEKVIPRVHAVYAGHPPPRFVCLLRDPVARARSHYLDMVRSGLESETLARAVELEPDRRPAQDGIRWCRYFGDGLYSSQLQAWFEAFGRESLLVLLTEELGESPRDTMGRIFEFLGVDPAAPIDTRARRNEAGVSRHRSLARFLNRPSVIKRGLKQAMPTALARRARGWLESLNTRRIDPAIAPVVPAEQLAALRERYAPEVMRLERLLERDLSAWRQGS